MTEPRREEELQAVTGTWFCPKCTYGNHAALRHGSHVAPLECSRCGAAKPAHPGDWAVLVNDGPWIGHTALVLGPVSEGRHPAHAY